MDDKNLCKFCNKIFASKSSLWNHQNKDPSSSICSYYMEEEKKRGRGRPPAKDKGGKKPKVEPPPFPPSPSRQYDVESDAESDVEKVEGYLYHKGKNGYGKLSNFQPVHRPQQTGVKFTERMPEYMFESFEKAKELIIDGVADKHIRTALKYDRCFKKDPNDLRKTFRKLYQKTVEPLTEAVKEVDEIAKTMEPEKQKELQKILNVEKGKSVAKLEEEKLELEKQLVIINYGLMLRKEHPSMKAIKLMESVIPESKLDDGIGVNVEVSNSQFEPDLVLYNEDIKLLGGEEDDEKEESGKEDDEKEEKEEKTSGWGIL